MNDDAMEGLNTIVRVDAFDAKRLIDAGITVLDALPTSIWREERLPGARSMPLETFEPSSVADLDRTTDLLVYCFDQHCDLSARLSRRLAELGFTNVHDLIGGRAAWTALGLPTEGSVGDDRRISQYVRTPATVPAAGTIADLVAIDDEGFPTPVLTPDGVLLGAIHQTARALPPTTPVADAMVPAPGTIRPEKRIEEVVDQLRRDGLDHVFVTAVNGVLVGLAVADDLHV
jgi:rhodanese-related sulfurtransferase